MPTRLGVDTSAVEIEVQKHTSVQEIVEVEVVENEEDALYDVAKFGLFDVIIEAAPVAVVADRSHISKLLFDCLKDDGIVSDVKLTLLNFTAIFRNSHLSYFAHAACIELLTKQLLTQAKT